jgi:iron complex transport system substrate-binding protein
VRSGRAFAADGNAYFNRPGPRLADSAGVLAEILAAGADGGGAAWQSLEDACASS